MTDLDSSLFDHARVDLQTLAQHAYNHRWAVQDADVIPLTAADSDFPVARSITEAMSRYLAAGYLPYGPAEGLPDFRHRAANDLRERRGIPCTPEHVLATNSAASALYLVAQQVLEPGDEVLIADPVDFLFERSVTAVGASVVRYGVGRNLRFDIEQIRRAIVPGRTKMLSICNPHNPLGMVWTRAELEQLASLAVEHDLLIMSDEVWSDIVYAPHQHTSIASLGDEVARRTFSIFGFSKSYGLAGLRLGVLVCPTPSLQQQVVQRSHADTTAYGVSTLSQVGGMAAYETAQGWLRAFVLHLRGQRDYAVERLNAMDGVQCHSPEGTFVVFPDVSEIGMPAEVIAERLQREHRVAVVPGSAAFFGPGAQGHLRLSLATSRELLQEGLDRVEAGLRAMRE